MAEPRLPVEVAPDESADAALGGAVRLIQPKKGYRFSLDAILLARFASEKPSDRVVDLGCGCGVVGLCLLALGGAKRVIGVDIQAEMAGRAARSAEWNGLAQQARFLEGDLRSIGEWLPPRSADRVVSNPPYRPLGKGKVSGVEGAALARHEVACSLADVAAAATHLLASDGEFFVVYPAERAATAVEACRRQSLEPKEMWPVYPRAGAAASLVLLRSVKGAPEGFKLRAPLFLHAAGSKYSPEAQTLLGPP